MKQTKYIPLIMIILWLSLVTLGYAENNDKDFSLSFRLGYRAVDQSGTLQKYKEDINLEDGMRLFDFTFKLSPTNELSKLFDRVDINVFNFGGDPFEALTLSVQKYSTYQVQFSRKKSSYYYADQHETGGVIYNPHTFDFRRITDSGLLKIWLLPSVNFYLDFNRYDKSGESITTLDINRIEFEFNQPIQEKSKEIAVGLNAQPFKEFSVVLEERILDYENSNSLFLPGYADGGEGARYPSSLNFFNLNQPYTLKSYSHTLKIYSQPIKRILLSGSAKITDQDLDLTYQESADGINYLGKFFDYSFPGMGKFQRKIGLYDLDLSFLLFDRLAITGVIRYHDFEQEGEMTVSGEKKTMDLNYDTLSLEGGIQYRFSSVIGLLAGYRNETRTLEGVETVDYEEKTVRQGLFGNIKVSPSRKFTLNADYQFGTYDHPFTLVSPAEFHRFSAKARLNQKLVSFSASYIFTKSKNDIWQNDWSSTRHNFAFSGSYKGKNINGSASYSYVLQKHQGNRQVDYPPSFSGPAGTFLWEILYEGKSNILNGNLSAKMAENWNIGGLFNYYTNKGFWEISRLWLKGYIEYLFEEGFLAQIGYRYVDFKEKDSGFNDYSANILELSFGYRWE